ncbi:phosphoribosylformylglycinamidine synthase subunit PurQ [Cerasicoccus arenae]|uniref:Phosphoribosylformylglycinamidine synthase subunit PurQ n=1 Tax=Cerasicoccus arenae TaxID=424488 RepID=A0A8J3GE29_9BACT|nr:phosphoribosylformylglycinamidine synthase subunit PurQ [Cerasicoccus arenae]MBK1858866.1 phosphoribosylformylglycinamidine synthase subunit PurQ [Cerasicoccus arenae]GHB96144.1 phosphoribosylformylglycinamidine synthase subunit PurQ [Cerasicoccus arenae]
MKIAVIQFPGSNCDRDAYHAFFGVFNQPTRLFWHKRPSLAGAECVVLPGGFSYGDYLRCGAIARFSPIMNSIIEFANNGGPVLGICNGFQILCEAGLLPGALVRNEGMEFVCESAKLNVEDSMDYFNQGSLGETIDIPIAHGEGNYRIDDDGLADLEANNQVLFRYANNPNGSISNIAGIRNKEGNVFGMMPHPERAVEEIHPSRDGIGVIKAFLKSQMARQQKA